MNQENNINNRYLRYYITLAIVLAIVLVLFAFFPISGDDWFRYGLGKSLNSISDLLNQIADKWHTNNARVLGNFLAYTAGSRPVFSLILKSLIVSLLTFLCAFITKEKSASAVLLVFIALFTIPQEMFIQIYPWEAGFYNYVPPVLVLFALLRISLKLFNGEMLQSNIFLCMFTLLLSCAGQLFIENITICILLTAVILNVWYYVLHKKLSGILVCMVIGALVGAMIMFLSPAYRSFFADGNGYQFGASAGISGLINSAKANCKTVFRFISFSCPILYSAWAVLAFFIYKNNIKKPKVLLASMIVNLICFLIFVANYLFSSLELLALVFSPIWILSVVLLAIYGTKDKRDKSLVIILFFMAMVSAGVMLFVSPVGPRCLYASYVLIIIATIIVYYSQIGKISEKKSLFVTALSSLLIVVSILSVYVPLKNTFNKQMQIIQDEMNKHSTEISIPAFDNERWLWDWNTNKIESAFYYSKEGDIVINFVPAEE